MRRAAELWAYARQDGLATADPHELMHPREAADDRFVAHLDMTRKRHVVDEDDAVADAAVMGDVDAGHEQAVIADAGDAAATFGAGIHGDMLADAVARADHQPRALAPDVEVLRHLADAL